MNIKHLRAFSFIEVLLSLILVSTAMMAYLELQNKITLWQEQTYQEYHQQLKSHNVQQ